MPVSETRIAARNQQGVEVFYQQTTLPSAENLEAYEAHFPGAAKIMIDMARNDQQNQWKNIHSESNKRFAIRFAGLVVAFVLCSMLIVGGTYLIAHDHAVTGFTSVVMALVTLIGSIANGNRSSSDSKTR